jgi:hypothetical protein
MQTSLFSSFSLYTTPQLHNKMSAICSTTDGRNFYLSVPGLRQQSGTRSMAETEQPFRDTLFWQPHLEGQFATGVLRIIEATQGRT